MHFKFVTRRIRHLKSAGGSDWISGEGCKGCSILYKVRCRSFRKYSFLQGKWMSLSWQFEARPFTTNNTNRVVHVFKAFLRSFVYIYQNQSIFLITFLWPLLWPLLRKKNLYHCIPSLNVTLIWLKTSKIISKCFWQAFNGLKSCIFKKLNFFLSITIC